MPPLRAMPVLVCASAALVCAEALAKEPVSLSWKAPAGCPTEADVRAEIDRLLGTSKAEAPLEVIVIVTRNEAGRHHAKLDIKGEDGPTTREVDAASCAAVSDAAALIVAMTIDPAAALAAPPPTANVEAPTPAKPPAEPTAAPQEPPEAGTPSSFRSDPGPAQYISGFDPNIRNIFHAYAEPSEHRPPSPCARRWASISARCPGHPSR